MKVTKVTELHPTGQSWQSQRGDTFFVFDISLEDGTTGQVNSRSEQSPPYIIGDEVQYEIVRVNSYGNQLKVMKPLADVPAAGKASSFNSKQSPDIQRRIDASWGVTNALSVLGSKFDPNAGASMAQLKTLAVNLINLRNDVVAHIEKHQHKNTPNEIKDPPRVDTPNDDLPY